MEVGEPANARQLPSAYSFNPPTTVTASGPKHLLRLPAAVIRSSESFKDPIVRANRRTSKPLIYMMLYWLNTTRVLKCVLTEDSSLAISGPLQARCR